MIELTIAQGVFLVAFCFTLGGIVGLKGAYDAGYEGLIILVGLVACIAFVVCVTVMFVEYQLPA